MRHSIFILCLLFGLRLSGQSDRVYDNNYLNWVQSFNTIALDKKWSLHMEYQWRRDHGLRNWQQSLLRLGVNYKLHENATLQAGYAWVETFPYGDYPIASNGTFPEHRLYEQISFRHPFGKWTLSHRLRVEQRWLGKVKPGTDREIEDWTFLHRFRYQFRAVYSFINRNSRLPYFVMADEILIGAGKNLGVNIFDQNRVYLLVGFKLNNKLSFEGGYFNQTLQQGRRVNDKVIVQRNNGWLISSWLNL